MNTPARASRLSLLLFGMVLLAAVILWSALTSWREGLKVRLKFESVRAENSHVSGHLRDAVQDLRSVLTTYEVTGETSRWTHFEMLGDRLADWIAEASRSPGDEAERALFVRVTAAFRDYRQEAKAIAGTRASDIRQPLLMLASELSLARRTALSQYVGESERAIVRMQQVIFIALLALLSFAAWAGHVIYRDTIAPLEVRLVETREHAERQEKLAALGVLAAGVAHEIRNPLTAIKARLYTQQKALTAGSSAQQDALVIGREIDRLAKITSEFLAFARPPEPVMEQVQASDLLQNVRELMAPKMAEEKIELVTEGRAEASIPGDPHQLQQVLINLVQNAAESIGHHGKILLRAGLEQTTLGGKAQEALVVEVQDSGKGIPADIQPRLFDPFFTTKPGGTGLGLSIAARIVEKHGGIIRCQTTLDRGATFAVILPTHA
jgi:signal transduction histidine kinase